MTMDAPGTHMILDESSPLTPEQWSWIVRVLGSPSAGVAKRLRETASELRDIADSLEADDDGWPNRALREHASEMIEVADWLDHKRRTHDD